jgi:hypothetical protein
VLHLPALTFYCVGGCWDRTQDSCDYGIDCQTLELFGIISSTICQIFPAKEEALPAAIFLLGQFLKDLLVCAANKTIRRMLSFSVGHKSDGMGGALCFVHNWKSVYTFTRELGQEEWDLYIQGTSINKEAQFLLWSKN